MRSVYAQFLRISTVCSASKMTTLRALPTMRRKHSDIKSRLQTTCFASANPEHNGSTLPHTTAKDFTVTQISEMLTVKPTALIEACEKERINPNMTQKEIREVVKELNGKKTVEGEAKEIATEKVEKKAEPEKALEGLTDDGIKAYREFRRQIDKAMGEKWYNMVTLTFIKEDGTKEEKILKVEDWYGKSIETEIIEKMEKAGI